MSELKVVCEAGHDRAPMTFDPSGLVWCCGSCPEIVTGEAALDALPAQYLSVRPLLVVLRDMLDAAPMVVNHGAGRLTTEEYRPSLEVQP